MQFTTFRTWIAKQSLSRWLGLIVGNTRELEQQISDLKADNLRIREDHKKEIGRLLVEKDATISLIEEQLKYWQNQFIEFQSSILVSKGMLPTQPTAVAPSPAPARQLNPMPGDNLYIEGKVDEIKELYFIRPAEAVERVHDLIRIGKPREMEVVRRVNEWMTLVDSHDGADQGGVVVSG